MAIIKDDIYQAILEMNDFITERVKEAIANGNDRPDYSPYVDSDKCFASRMADIIQAAFNAHSEEENNALMKVVDETFLAVQSQVPNPYCGSLASALLPLITALQIYLHSLDASLSASKGILLGTGT